MYKNLSILIGFFDNMCFSVLFVIDPLIDETIVFVKNWFYAQWLSYPRDNHWLSLSEEPTCHGIWTDSALNVVFLNYILFCCYKCFTIQLSCPLFSVSLYCIFLHFNWFQNLTNYLNLYPELQIFFLFFIISSSSSKNII